jgi:hypothetical protein
MLVNSLEPLKVCAAGKRKKKDKQYHKKEEESPLWLSSLEARLREGG